jgi:hypothetical protein
MAKVVVQHDVDPAIAIVLEEVLEGTPGRARGFSGTCTECGRPMHQWFEAQAIAVAKRHVDAHESGL